MALRPKPASCLKTALLGTTCGITLMAFPLNAALADTVPKTKSAIRTQAENISVQGTKQSGISVLSNSTRTNSTVQVFRYSAKQLQETGQTNVLAAIAQLSPAVTSTPFAGIGGNGFNRTMQLRNLGADQTLMLVNGKRRHVDANFNYYQSGQNYGTDPSDISLIPMSAIDHVEIITEGATALYGQDAEAGAVNIVLKEDTGKMTLSLQNSGYYAGDGQNLDGMFDRGFRLGRTGSIHLAGQITNQLGTNRSGPYPTNLYFTANDPRAAMMGKDVQRIAGTPRSLLGAGSINAVYPMGEHFVLYNATTYAHKNIVQAETYRAPSNDNTVRALWPNGMQPLWRATENDFQVNSGIRSSNFLGAKWDLYVTYGRDQMDNWITDTNNPTYGAQSPTGFYTGSYVSSGLTAGLRSTKFFHASFLPRPVDLTYGFEYRRDAYTIEAGSPGSTGDGGQTVLDGPHKGAALPAGSTDKFGVPNVAAGTLTRNVFDGKINLDAYATRNWEWTLGGHVVGYSDVSLAPTGSIGTRYNVSKNLAFRGNVNTGYRPPTLAEEAFFAETTFPTYRTAQLPVNSRFAQILGASKLKAEQSRSYSVGLDAHLTPDWTLTANLYRISINNRLYNTSQFGGAAIQSLLTSVGLPGVLFASYYTNPVNTTTNGGDITTAYDLKTTRVGNFHITFSMNIADTQITHINATPDVLVNLNLSVFNRTNAEYLQHSAPRNVENLGIMWDMGRWSARVQEQRFGSYTWVASPALPQTSWTYIRPSFITNIELGVDPLKNCHVAVGAYNLGNKYPGRANATSRAALQNAFLYPGNSPYGFNGGMYYVKAAISF